MQVNRHLYRCRHDRRIAGVASGVAEYFDLDPSLVRVLWFVSMFFGGLSLVLYFGLWIIVPLEPLSGAEAATEAAAAPAGHHHATRGDGRWTTFIGIALVLFGAIALVDALLPSADAWRYLWPLFVVGLGGVLIAGAVRRERTEPREPQELNEP
jgi:phage shock protein C